MEAAGEPLLALTSIRHEDTRPSEPGPDDQLMQELVTRLELARDKDTREVVAVIMEQLLRSAWPGRWATSCPLWSSLCTRCPGDTRARTRPQICILELATCDIEAARLLYHDLENLPPSSEQDI